MPVIPPIVFEDDSLMAFDKPSGLLVAPDRWDKTRTHLMGLVHARWGHGVANVHRLDADTSGLLLCAKTKPALDFLSGQFQAKTVQKVYHALVVGAPPADADGRFTVDLALGEDERRAGRMRVYRRGGKASLTHFQVKQQFRGFAWVVCQPLTGRTHQLRVHLAAVGTPILNDSFYGDGETRLLLSRLKRGYKGRAQEKPLITRLALHAAELTLTHPETRAPITLRSELPHEFAVALKYLQKFAA